jgi:hypothetical protein
MATLTKPRAPCKTKAPVFSVELVAATIRLNGHLYHVEPIGPGEDGSVAYRLEKAGDPEGVYDVIRTLAGLVECSCPDYEARHRGLDCGACKHGRALVTLGLMAAPKPEPTPVDRQTKPALAPEPAPAPTPAATTTTSGPAPAPDVAAAVRGARPEPRPVTEADRARRAVFGITLPEIPAEAPGSSQDASAAAVDQTPPTPPGEPQGPEGHAEGAGPDDGADLDDPWSEDGVASRNGP